MALEVTVPVEITTFENKLMIQFIHRLLGICLFVIGISIGTLLIQKKDKAMKNAEENNAKLKEKYGLN